MSLDPRCVHVGLLEMFPRPNFIERGGREPHFHNRVPVRKRNCASVGVVSGGKVYNIVWVLWTLPKFISRIG